MPGAPSTRNPLGYNNNPTRGASTYQPSGNGLKLSHLLPFGVGQGIAQYDSNQQVNETNIQLANAAQEFEQKMWAQNNAYNSPKAQMQRFSEAGLNPKLIYGSGSISGNAAAPPSPHVPNIVGNMQNVQIPNVLGILQAYQQIKKTGVETDAIQANVNMTKQRTISEMIKQGIFANQKTISGSKAQYSSKLESYNAANKEYDYMKKWNEYEFYVPIDRELKQLELSSKRNQLNMDSTLKPYLMTGSDPIASRLMLYLLKQIGIVK